MKCFVARSEIGESATIGGHIYTAEACGLLADLFEHGSYGVTQDSEKSFYWRALEKRHSSEPL